MPLVGFIPYVQSETKRKSTVKKKDRSKAPKSYLKTILTSFQRQKVKKIKGYSKLSSVNCVFRWFASIAVSWIKRSSGPLRRRLVL